MKKNPTFTHYCLLIFLLAGLSACSSLTSTNYYDSSRSEIVADYEYDQPQDTRIIPVESEQDLEEELAALEKLGDWSEGSPSQTEIPTEIVYDFPITINKQVDFYLDQFQNKQKKYFKRWLERSTKYLPAIRHELRVAGLPQDLAYLAMIESGYNPSAYSHAHAAGLWQFIPGTGRNYGLRIDSWVDERREPEKATKAAVAYLGALYERFGDWQLAVAGYNAGEGTVSRAIKANKRAGKPTNYTALKLRSETRRYVPKLIAFSNIIKNPEKYGLKIARVPNEPYFSVVRLSSQVELGVVADAANIRIEELEMLKGELCNQR